MFANFFVGGSPGKSLPRSQPNAKSLVSAGIMLAKEPKVINECTFGKSIKFHKLRL